MTKRLALAGCVLAAATAFAAPASAAPCAGMTIPRCLEPLFDKLKHLCFPPDPADPYGC